MASSGAETGRIGRPPRLSRAAIISAAQRILEQDGPEGLSMRRVAKELSSTAMSLYHHVRDKDELLLLLLEEHARRTPRPALPEAPRERLVATACHLHDVLAGCPWIVEVLTSDDLTAVSALWMVEGILDAAVGCGLSPEQAVHVYRSIWYYTAGEILVRAGRNRRYAELDRPAYRDQALAALDPADFPRLSALAGQWPELTLQDTHRQDIQAIVDGLLQQAGV